MNMLLNSLQRCMQPFCGSRKVHHRNSMLWETYSARHITTMSSSWKSWRRTHQRNSIAWWPTFMRLHSEFPLEGVASMLTLLAGSWDTSVLPVATLASWKHSSCLTSTIWWKTKSFPTRIHSAGYGFVKLITVVIYVKSVVAHVVHISLTHF